MNRINHHNINYYGLQKVFEVGKTSNKDVVRALLERSTSGQISFVDRLGYKLRIKV